MSSYVCVCVLFSRIVVHGPSRDSRVEVLFFALLIDTLSCPPTLDYFFKPLVFYLKETQQHFKILAIKCATLYDIKHSDLMIKV